MGARRTPGRALGPAHDFRLPAVHGRAGGGGGRAGAMLAVRAAGFRSVDRRGRLAGSGQPARPGPGQGLSGPTVRATSSACPARGGGKSAAGRRRCEACGRRRLAARQCEDLNISFRGHGWGGHPDAFSTKKKRYKIMRRTALQSVPFSSIFYCSNPLAAALTRRRLQIFLLIIALLHLPDCIKFLRWREFTVLRSQYFRFTLLQCSHDPYQKRSLRFGITMDGKVLETIEKLHSFDETSMFNLSASSVWNGWFFEFFPNFDVPIKFSLHTIIDDEWKQVGSSSYVQVADNTIFLNGYFKPVQGPNHFQLSSPGYFGYWLSRLGGGMCNAGLFLSGATGRSRTGTACFSFSFFFFFIALQLIEAYSTFALNGNYSYIACLILVLVFLGAIALGLVQGRWIDTLMWQGACFLGAGILLCMHGEEGQKSGLLLACGVGAPHFLLSAGVKLSGLYIRWASRRAIAPDVRRYTDLWAVLVADDESKAQLQVIEALVSDFAARVREGAPTGRAAACPGTLACRASPTNSACGRTSSGQEAKQGLWSVAEPGACRQSLPPRRRSTWAGGVLDGLLQACAGREEYPVLADLHRLYDQAAAADPVLRSLVFEWAQRSGGYLPFQRAERKTAAVDRAGVKVRISESGSFRWRRRTSAGAELPVMRVAEDDSEEDVAWAGLKRMERSIEKVRKETNEIKRFP